MLRESLYMKIRLCCLYLSMEKKKGSPWACLQAKNQNATSNNKKTRLSLFRSNGPCRVSRRDSGCSHERRSQTKKKKEEKKTGKHRKNPQMLSLEDGQETVLIEDNLRSRGGGNGRECPQR
jgi:hypothetical protein